MAYEAIRVAYRRSESEPIFVHIIIIFSLIEFQHLHATLAHIGTSSAGNLLAAPLPPLKIFEQIVEMSFHYLEEPAASRLFLLVNQINTLESIPEQIKEIVSSRDVVRASLPLILKGQHMGEIKTGDPLSLALAFWGALQGIAEVRLWLPDAPVPDSRCIVDILKVRQE